MNAIAILIHESRFKKHQPLVRKVLAHGMKTEKCAGKTVTVVLTNDKEIRALNHDYRGKKKPTNVLAFPSEPSPRRRPGATSRRSSTHAGMDTGLRRHDDRETELCHLGDIVLAYETIVKEAKEQGKKTTDHLAHLTLHGLLHLLGHDHLCDDEANRMEKKEIKLLAALGIANPYLSH